MASSIILPFLIFTFQSCFSDLLQAQVLAEDVRIESVYHDNVSVQGTGPLIEVQFQGRNHYFIVTAAHISQGNDLKIRVHQKSIGLISPEARISDNRRDVELFEINPDSQYRPLARLYEEEGTQPYLKINPISIAPQGQLYFADTLTPLNPFYLGVQFDRETKKPFPVHSFILFPQSDYQNYAENKSSLTKSGPGFLDQIEESTYGDTLFTPHSGLIAPGMSGAPLIQSHRVNGMIIQTLDGIAIQFQRFGSKSFFATSSTIIELIQRYFSGQRGPIEETQWKVENGFLYREFCFVVAGNCLSARENIPQKLPAGGVRGDGGLSPSSRERTLTLEHIGSPLKILDQDVAGIKITHKKSGETFYVEANWAAIDFLNQNRMSVDFDLIGPEFPAIPIFLQHYRRHLPGEIQYPLSFVYKDFPSTRVNVFEDRIELQLPGAKLPSSNGAKAYERDLVFIKLDKNGRQVSNGVSALHFHPIIKATGHLSNADYLVDIRQLFFFDLSEIPKDDSFYSTAFHLKDAGGDRDGLIQRAYNQGGLLNLHLVGEPVNNLIIQLYLPKDGFLDSLFHPILNFIDPIGEE